MESAKWIFFGGSHKELDALVFTVCARTTAVATPTAEATETLLGSTASRLPRPATAHPGPSLPTTHPGGALAGLGTHGSAGGGRWQRHLVAGVVGGGGVRGRHGTPPRYHHGHPHRRRQNTTARPSLCVPHLPMRQPVVPLDRPHAWGRPFPLARMGGREAYE